MAYTTVDKLVQFLPRNAL